MSIHKNIVDCISLQTIKGDFVVVSEQEIINADHMFTIIRSTSSTEKTQTVRTGIVKVDRHLFTYEIIHDNRGIISVCIFAGFGECDEHFYHYKYQPVRGVEYEVYVERFDDDIVVQLYKSDSNLSRLAFVRQLIFNKHPYIEDVEKTLNDKLKQDGCEFYALATVVSRFVCKFSTIQSIVVQR